MVVQSNGNLVKSVVYQEFTNYSWNGIPQPGITLADRDWTYAAMYRRHLWVSTVVNKRANGTARLPLKVYRRSSDGAREEARDHTYAQLLRQPNPLMSSFYFWLWVSSTYDVYGEAFLAKVRDRSGEPVELWPLSPTNLERDDETGKWKYTTGRMEIENIRDEDLVMFRNFNPDSFYRGISKLEPLRDTLENEANARAATSSFWQNGARPGVALTHPNKLSKDAMDRLKIQWDSLTAGADKTGKTVVLEEGMRPEILQITAEEAQYIQTRQLNREEVCAVYDVPPPVVHILDHATFSNITEQMRSMYRDTMAPHLKAFEAELAAQLWPDFGDEDDIYAEFLLDEVLRGDFEARAEAYQKGINSGWLMSSEAREKENLPFVEGSDKLLINSTLIPIDKAGEQLEQAQEAQQAQEAASELEEGEPPVDNALRTVMGRLAWQKSIDEVEESELTKGLDFLAELVVGRALNKARQDDVSVGDLKQRITEALGG